MEQDADVECATPSPGLGNVKSKLDTLSKEDLIKFAKKQMVVMQKMKSKCADLEKEVEALKVPQSASSDDSVIQALTERMNAVLLEKAETEQNLVLLRKENEKVKKQAEAAMENTAALQEKLEHMNKEHTEKIKAMVQNLETSEAKYQKELESFKKRESEHSKNEEVQRQQLTEEFNSNIDGIRQEYEKKISDLQQDLELAKREWAAETVALRETHQAELKKSRDDVENLHEEIAKLSKQHEAELRDLEEQLELNAADFEMERERLLLLQDSLAEQLALKESYLQDVQEEEEDVTKNGAQKALDANEVVDSSTFEEQDSEMDRWRQSLEDVQSQNTMLQEELTFLRNVKTELEGELQHLKEEFSMEKEELEFKINELQMTKEDGDACVEKVHTDQETNGDQELHTLKELHQTEIKELESRLVNAEREKEAIIQEVKDLHYKCEILSQEKNAAVGEYEHTKEILRNIELELGDRTNDFVKQYNAMKEQAALSIQELQERLAEKDSLLEKLQSLKQELELKAQTDLNKNEDSLSQPESQEEKHTVVTSDKETQAVIETMDEQMEAAQLNLQKLEECSTALESALVEKESLKNSVSDLEDKLSSSVAEKDQLAERCNGILEDLAALQAAEEQSQATISQLETMTQENKTELSAMSEERDVLRKDMEVSEQKLLHARTHISELLQQNYSLTIAGDEDISALLSSLLSNVEEEKATLTQQMNDFVKQYNAMKEETARSIQELQEKRAEKDSLVEKLQNLEQELELKAQTDLNKNEDSLSQPESQEEKHTVVTSDKETQAVIETMDEQMEAAQLNLQKLEDLSTALESALVEKESLKNSVSDLEDKLSSSVAEKDQLAERCNALLKDMAALQAAEEQSQATINQLETMTQENKTELSAMSEERDVLKKDMEVSEQKLLHACIHISELLQQNYSLTIAREEDISALLSCLLSKVQEEKATLTQQMNDFVKQYNTMKEEAALSIQELQEKLAEKDSLVEKLQSLEQELELKAQTDTKNEDSLSQPESQEEKHTVVTSDKETQAVIETMDEQMEAAQLNLQKLEDLSTALESALVEKESLKNSVSDLEDKLSSSVAEKDQLAERCNGLLEDLAALQAAEEQSQATINQLETMTQENKTELSAMSEERDALRKDMEVSEQKLLHACTHISELLQKNYSLTIAREEDISALLSCLLSKVEEEKATLTQQLEERTAQLTNMPSQEVSEEQAGLHGEEHLQSDVLNQDRKEDHAELQSQIEENSSQVVDAAAGLVGKEHKQPLDETDAQETDDMKRFQQILSEKESIITQLKEEISHLQESKMSTLNENLKQIETLAKETKEKDERMNKIKAVAVKAKKELENSRKEASELKEELDALKSERDKLSESMKGIIHGAEDYKNLMIDYDKQTELLDTQKEKLEAAEKQNTDLTKRLQAAVEQNKLLLSEREDLMTRMETIQSNVRQLEAQILELHRLKSGLERDLETERLLKEQKTKEHQSAVKEAEEMNVLLQRQKQQLQQTEQELEQLRKDAQQSTLLDMEMADYERLVKELNQQISEKDRLIKEQESLAQAQRDREEKQNQEIVSLKSLVDAAEEKASKMKQLLVKTKKDLADSKKEEASQMIIQSSLKGELEASQQQLENYKIQCSELTADRHRLQEQLKSVNDQHQKAFSSYQHQLTSLQDELSSKKDELDSTVSEFEGYKVRVHNVLKQQKNRSSAQNDGEFSKQEREHMESMLEQLRSKLQESQLNLQSSSLELQQLHSEHDMLLERHNKMLQQTVTKEAELRERVLSLHSENVALKSEHSQSVSQLTTQAETMRSSFREQLHHLQEEHRSTVETLQQQINRLEAQLFQLQKEPANNAPVQQSRKPQTDRKLAELPLFELQNMAREEGEGMEMTESESVSTTGTPTPSLEQLLTSPDPKQEPFVWQVEPTKEELTQKLNTATRSMDHVNSLLHESEATNAILIEQNNLLKSELRRLERNQEREKSVANLEYLKNVLLQFIFLRSGSEKQALLPVIHTMLQLSPEEKSKLAAIAHGEEEAAGSRGSGWTSYLHSWSGIR